MILANLHKALGDETRLRIIHMLHAGWLSVQEITAILDGSQSTVSHHLKILHATGFLQCRREGTWSYYSLAAQQVSPLTAKLIELTLDLAGQKECSVDRPTLQRDRNAVRAILDRRRAEQHAYFESIAGEWRELRPNAHGGAAYLEHLATRIPTDGTLVEAGCGSGALLELLLPRNGATIGVDYSQAMLSEAQSSLAAAGKRADLRVGALEHLPLADRSADVAVASMVLHHVEDPAAALLELARVVKPGGRLFICELTAHSDETMRERFADRWLGFDPREVSAWCKDAGFTVQELVEIGANKEIFILDTLLKENN